MADVVLKNQDGERVEYSAIGVKLYDPQGNLIPFGVMSLQQKSVMPAQQTQEITPDSGYDGMSKVTVGAMPSGTAGTPTVTKGTPSGGSVTVTPSVTNVGGYIEGGTEVGQPVSVSAAELVSGTEDISDTAQHDVTNKKYAQVSDVNLAAGNIKSGVTILGVPGSLRPAPDWTEAGEANNWTAVYFNRAFDWAILLPTLDYDNGKAMVGIYLSGDSGGLLIALDLTSVIPGWYALALLYAEEDAEDSAQLLPVYSTKAGEAEITFSGLSATLEAAEGWNNPTILLPGGAGKLALLSEYRFDGTVFAGAHIAFGDFVQPSGSLSITGTAEVDVREYASARVTDPNLRPENIRKGVTILGVTGTYEPEPSEGEAVTVDGDTLIFDGNTAVDGDTLILAADAHVDGDTLIFDGGQDAEVQDNVLVIDAELRDGALEINGHLSDDGKILILD